MNFRIFVITGGLGFIGKYFVKKCLELGDYVINIDVVNYAADRVIMREFAKQPNYQHIKEDLAQLTHLPECDYIVNFAAESHVDESISDNSKFCRSNVMGVQRLLELIRKKMEVDQPRLIQISTDEVYGEIADGRHNENHILKPSNPYAATKAAADLFILGWFRTYNVKYNIIRLSNNYGSHQYPEKLIPKSCSRMMRNLPALMHGDGSYIRSWLHAGDAAEAILTVIEKGELNQIYNVCGDVEVPNIEILRKLAELIGIPEDKAFINCTNRVGQDIRYSLDDSKIRALGWKPKRDFDKELKKIVQDFDFERFL